MTQYKLPLRNYAGQIVRTFIVDEQIAEESTATDPKPSHLIFVADCSGSMYYDIAEVRSMLEKLLTIEEFHNANMLISLISYASQGDVAIHFGRVPVEQVMAAGSPHVDGLRSLRTRGLTCMSQSLSVAKTLVHDGETTCISLHSDGYANDRSPTLERRLIEEFVHDLAEMPGVFVNTVAYRNWSDFQMLSWIANASSGTCMRATSTTDVFSALHDTSKLLTGDMAPAVTSEIGDADLQVFLSTAAKKVLGTAEDLEVRGLSASDDKVIYKFTEVSADTYDASTFPTIGEDGVTVSPALAYARAALSMGEVNAAKYAVVTTRNSVLLEENYRALTGPQIAEFATALETLIFVPTATSTSPGYGLELTRPSVLSIAGILSGNRDKFRVNVPKLRKVYTRRGLKRVPGTRDAAGNLISPETEAQDRGNSEYQKCIEFAINQTTATINMNLMRPIKIARLGQEVDEIAGIYLDELATFANYTLVGDGETLVKGLPVRISSKALFDRLIEADSAILTTDDGVVVTEFNPEECVWIELADLPLVDFDQKFEIESGTFNRLAVLTAARKLLSGLLGSGSSTSYTKDQVTALKEHCLTPALNFSPPTVNTYTDLDKALERGEVDTRLSYKITLGTTAVTGLGKLSSGNKCFERFFTIEEDGEGIPKPKLPMVWNDNVVLGYKKLSARTVVTAVDNLQKPVFEDLLGLSSDYDSSDTVATLKSAGVDVETLLNATARRNLSAEDTALAISAAGKRLDEVTEKIFHDQISPLVFFVGATGLVPDELEANALTAAQFTEEYPDTKLAKAEKEATFFVIGDHVLTVYVKGEHFTTERAAA